MRLIYSLLAAALCITPTHLFAQGADVIRSFRSTEGWSPSASSDAQGPVLTTNVTSAPVALVTSAELADSVVELDYKAPQGTRATVFLHGRYEVELPVGGESWRHFRAQVRAPRIDDGRNKLENALILEARVDDTPLLTNQIFEGVSPSAPSDRERSRGPAVLVVSEGSFAVRAFEYLPADFQQITLPPKSGAPTNAAALVDFVALGRERFESVGCSACHSVKKNDSAVTSGPNLYGLFKREPRLREVIEGAAGQRFTVRADATYLRESLRRPAAQLAIAEHGAKRGEAYPALMPTFTSEIVSDVQLQAIGAYLATLNDPQDVGPVIVLSEQSGRAPLDPMQDRLQLLVDDEVRIQRGPMPGVSGRAIHVGQPNGIHYSFDPRILGFAKIWQGGFLDRSGELLDRGGRGFKTGHDSREISLGDRDYVFAPLKSDGTRVDFSFKEAKFGDAATVRASLYSTEDHLARLAAMDAKFLGYSRNSKNKLETPRFRYRVGKNTLSVAMTLERSGEVRFEIEGERESAQRFAFNPQVLHEIEVTKGSASEGVWTIPAGGEPATLRAKIALSADVWRPAKSEFDYRRQPLEIVPATAHLPAGYSIESYLPPKDNFGRDQLFEALGLALAEDGTVFVATRTAGIWRLAHGEWQLFAEGPFDSLGILVEDKQGRSVIVGQKAELTRITDRNGDGLADDFETLFDAHSYHSNYHTYMHGPIRGTDGAYYIAINLAHANDGSTYKAGGEFMGTTGGFTGWAFRVQPDGTFTPWARGLRSPAGLGVAPDGRLFYSDNQGEYVGTSKLFVLKRDGFYGHPASLVDLPGMTPDSPEIQWENVASTRERPVVLFPHNRVANSPGHPTWDTTKGKFGPFAGQMLIGDQTQSNLLRVTIERVDDVEQGSVMPFMDGLESGAMRPLFLDDGSLLLGQTGRGWQAKGGRIASLQHIRWDGKTIPVAIRSMHATRNGFRLELTQPIAPNIGIDDLKRALQLRSWVYRDAPDYGSDELDSRNEAIESLALSKERKTLFLSLASLVQPRVHPQQTARVYHVELKSDPLFDADAPQTLDAYYTLYAFPKGTAKDHE